MGLGRGRFLPFDNFRKKLNGVDDMSKSSFSTRSDLDDTALGWATGQCSPLPRRHKNAIFDIFFTRFGKTSRKAARAVRDFVTCSSPQSNGFSAEDVITNTSRETPTDVQDETPSTTSHLHRPRDKPHVRDVFTRHQDFNEEARHPSHGHRKKTHGRAAANGERNLWAASGAEVASTSNCGPKLPSNFFELPTKQRLRAVKQFLAGFAYKPNSETSLQANKQRPLCRLMATARRIVYKPEPIKSVEAVFLALYLTAGLLSVDRVPVSFKTKYVDEVSQHTVLLVQCNGKYGAFGISPNPHLMTKNLHFDSMSSIIENYVRACEASARTVLKIRIGLPVEHDVLSSHFISWRHLCLSPDTKSWAECVVEIENHALRMRRLWDLWVLNGKGDDPRKAGMAKRKVESANFTPREKKTAEKPGVASEAKKQLPGGRSRTQAPAQAMATESAWDAESTGSNTDEHCEHCEQLKKAMPPADTKRATLTTVKRIKTSGHHDTKLFNPKSKIPGQRFTHSQSSEQQWEAESFESNTGDCAQKPSVHFNPKLNHTTMAATKQMLKGFVSSNVLSTPPRRLTRRNGTRQTTRKAADTKLQDERARRKNPGPLYNLAFSGTKSKAG